jgi:hypothetical protein
MRSFMIAAALTCAVAACSESNIQRLPIGAACSTSGQCGTGKFFCVTGHPNGYCKADCHTDKDCPAGSVCAGAGTISLGQCHKSCTMDVDDNLDDNMDSGCRAAEGYFCKMNPDDASGAYCDPVESNEGDDGGA